MSTDLVLIVPVKRLRVAKSRLLGTARERAAHTDLVAAMALDTVDAARRAPGVREVVVVTSDSRLTAAFAAEDVKVLPDTPSAGLNAALRHADELLRRADPARWIGALQADLPALRAEELGDAVTAAGQSRSFCPDRQETGTTLLLGDPGRPLDPRFGPDSTTAHRDSGAKPLRNAGISLRCDVDTESDLTDAALLGMGRRTAKHLL